MENHAQIHLKLNFKSVSNWATYEFSNIILMYRKVAFKYHSIRVFLIESFIKVRSHARISKQNKFFNSRAFNQREITNQDYLNIATLSVKLCGD